MPYVFSQCLDEACNTTVGDFDDFMPYVPSDPGILNAYLAAVANAKGTTISGDYKSRIAALLIGQGLTSGGRRTGWVPIYCSDSIGTRDNIFREFGNRGWSGGERWSNTFNMGGSGGSRRSTYYGVHFPLQRIPEHEREAAVRRAAGMPEGEPFARTLDLCVNAKGRMRAYGGVENYNDMFADAIAVGTPVITPQAAGSQVTGTMLPTEVNAPQRAPTAVVVLGPDGQYRCELRYDGTRMTTVARNR